MADDKKKSDKKPDKKKEAPPSKTGHDALFEIAGFFIAVIILISALSGFSVLNFLKSTPTDNSSTGSSDSIKGDYSFWQNLIGKTESGAYSSPQNLSLGTEVMNKGLTQVRREPAGSVIGLQQRGASAKITDGPVSLYGSRWWMVDYDNPPSGWVDEQDLTTGGLSYSLINLLLNIWDYIKMIGWGLTIIFILIIIYIAIREMSVPVYYDQTQNKKPEPIAPTKSPTTTGSAPMNLPTSGPLEQPEENTRWKHVELLIKSHNSSDWRQAIIEADVMLEDMLDKMGYPGVSIGDKLKNIEENDFNTLDKAWEAHKVRNRIAHDGGEYKLQYDEVVRVIGLYHDVFKEFYWV